MRSNHCVVEAEEGLRLAIDQAQGMRAPEEALAAEPFKSALAEHSSCVAPSWQAGEVVAAGEPRTPAIWVQAVVEAAAGECSSKR